MKKVVLSLAVFAAMLVSAFSAQKKTKELVLEPIEFDTVIQESEDFIYTSDPRTNVIGMMLRLAGYEKVQTYYIGDNSYLDQMNTLFDKYREHKSISVIQRYKEKKVPEEAWFALAYHIKPDFSGVTVDFDTCPETLPSEFQNCKTKELYKIVRAIHDFAEDTNFARIYNLNRSDYINNIAKMQNLIEPYRLPEFAEYFFNNPEIEKVTVDVSRIFANVYTFSFATNAESKKEFIITIYPGLEINSLFSSYFALYTQKYASENWELVKDNFTTYIKAYNTKVDPKNARQIKKQVITEKNLETLLGFYSCLAYCTYRAETQTEEDIKKTEDFVNICETYAQALKKGIGKDYENAAALLTEYKNNRDKYKTLEDFAPKINDFLNNLKVE